MNKKILNINEDTNKSKMDCAESMLVESIKNIKSECGLEFHEMLELLGDGVYKLSQSMGQVGKMFRSDLSKNEITQDQMAEVSQAISDAMVKCVDNLSYVEVMQIMSSTMVAMSRCMMSSKNK